MINENPFRKLSSKIVYQNPWIQVHEDSVIRPDGSAGIYGYVESKDSVKIVAMNEKQEVYLVRSFRYPTASWIWELPGGSSDGEDIVVASKRELAEETGITAETWTLLGKTVVCNGLMTERQAVLLAQDLTIGARPVADDALLVTEGKFVSFADIDHMIDTGEIDDNMTITGLFLAQRQVK